MLSSWDVQNPQHQSNWEETPNTANTANAVSTAATGSNAIQLQLFAVIGVLLVVAVAAVSIAFSVSGIKFTTTVSTTTTTATTATTSTSTTTTINPYTCGNMTILLNTDLPGNDIGPSPMLNYSACCTYCLTTSNCVGLTFVTGGKNCYRKSSIGSGGSASSGQVSVHY